MFAPRQALFCHVPIESALTEYQRKVTQSAYPQASASQTSDSGKEEQATFSSLNGPYYYENGSLRQSQPPKPESRKVKTVDEMSQSVRMDSEYYSIEVVFEVAMTRHNYERGNLYLQSEFHSYKQGVQNLTLSRSGFLDPKGSLTLTLKELAAMVPFLGYFYSCEPTETVTIKIFERFDNEDYGLRSIDLLVPNEAL